MLNKFHLFLIIILLLLGFSSYILLNKYVELQEEYLISMNNIKALTEDNLNLNGRIIEYKMTTDQLKYSKDSIVVAMNTLIEELDIKNKNIERLEYIASTATKKDTLYIRDTIFRNENFTLDTLKENKWYSIRLSLSYPNKIGVTPTFKSEKYIITHYKKETIKPPKKCAMGRLFQRKHKVLEVEIIEKNPYINTEKEKFIKIIK